MKNFTYTLIGKKGIEGRKQLFGTYEQAMKELAAQVYTNKRFHKGKKIVLWDMSAGAGVALQSVTL